MPSPAFVDCDQYGVDTAQGGGDWPTSRTLSPPSFGADTCLVVLVADYVHFTVDPHLDHWNVPASWFKVDDFGGQVFGPTSSVRIRGAVYQCRPTQVAATVRPEMADNSLFTPSGGSFFNYWRVFVTGWTPAKLWNTAITGLAGQASTTIPSDQWGTTTIDGVGEGTFVQFTAGNLGYLGGPTGVHTANGFADDHAAGEFRVASRQYATDTTTPGCVYTKTNAVWSCAATIVVSLDVRMRRGGRHLGLVRGSRGVG